MLPRFAIKSSVSIMKPDFWHHPPSQSRRSSAPDSRSRSCPQTRDALTAANHFSARAGPDPTLLPWVSLYVATAIRDVVSRASRHRPGSPD